MDRFDPALELDRSSISINKINGIHYERSHVEVAHNVSIERKPDARTCRATHGIGERPSQTAPLLLAESKCDFPPAPRPRQPRWRAGHLTRAPPG